MTWLDSHVGDANIRRFYLVHLGFDTPLYLTDCDIALRQYSQTWTPTALQVTSIARAGTQSRATVAIGDPNGTLFDAVSALQGGMGVAFAVYAAWLATDNVTGTPDYTEVLFSGIIETATKSSSVEQGNQIEISGIPSSKTDAALIPRRKIASLLRSA